MTLFQSAVIIVLLAASNLVEATKKANPQQTILSVDSPIAQRLLALATVVESSKNEHLIRRRLDQEQQQQQDNGNGISDLANLYISYQGCSTFLAPNQDGNGGDADIDYYNMQQYAYQQNQQQDADDTYYNDGLVRQNLVLFTLCTQSDCSACSGTYAVDMVEFLDAYTEIQMELDEYQCEYVREHCYCSNGYYSYESCLTTCYTNAGLDGCMQAYYGGESFQLQEYLECQAAFGGGNGGNGNNNNHNYYYNKNKNNFYIGPYCADGKNVYLGAFYDEDCSNQADSETFQAQNYGDGFPYFNDPILSGNECISCLKLEDNYNNGYDDDTEYESNELCETSTEEAVKCDSDRGYSSGCDFLEYTLPCLDGRGCVERNDDSSSKEEGSSSGGSSSGGSSSGSSSSAELYREMAEKFEKYKKAAYVLGATALVFFLACVFMITWCCCQPSLLASSKKNPLLRRRPVGKVHPAPQQ